MQLIQANLQRLQNEYLICPVSLEPLTEAVSLIPCSHKVNRVAAEEIFGKTNEALGKTNEDGWRSQLAKPCPLCRDLVFGYKIDYTIRNIVEQLFEIIEEANFDDEALMKNLNKFLKIGNLDKALEVAEAIADNFLKSKALMKIVNKFLEKENPDKALEVAKVITDDYYLNKALGKIFNQFLELADVNESLDTLNRALEATEAMTDDYLGSEALVATYNKFLALKVMISNNDLNKALMTISAQFLEKGNMEKALEVAKAMNSYSKSEALMKIFNKFLKLADVDESLDTLNRALEVTEVIPDEYLGSKALMAISSKFLKLKDSNKVMANNGDLNKVLMRIVNKFLGKGNLDRALKFSKAITNDYLKSGALVIVSSKFSEYGYTNKSLEILDEALEVAKAITDNYDQK